MRVPCVPDAGEISPSIIEKASEPSTLEVSLRSATLAIDASASPLNPNEATDSNSSKSRTLLVA